MPWSWILVLFSFEPLDGVSGPINDIHALMMDYICAALYVITSRTVFLLDDGTIYHDRVVHLCILRVGENDPYEFFIYSY